MNKGFFITVEGGEGSGKSTLCDNLKVLLEAQGLKVIITREPGGIEVSEKIRSLIMDYDITPKTEALLFAAARVEHLHKKVIPFVNDGYVVISDRYIDSSVVYQGYARGLGVDVIRDLNLWATDDYLPSLTLFLDLDPKIGMERIRLGNRETNRFDDEAEVFHERLVLGYNEVLKAQEHVYTVDANQTPQALADCCYTRLMELINE